MAAYYNYRSALSFSLGHFTVSTDLAFYGELLGEIKTRIRQSQTRALLAVNAELVRLYWDIGRLIDLRQQAEGWGAGVIPRLSRDLHNELPEQKGFSERNIKRMLRFYREHPGEFEKVPQPVAQIPWGHIMLLLEKVKDSSIRLWYAHKTLEQGWSRDILAMMIQSDIYKRQGNLVSNFSSRLPAPQSDLVQQTLKDPYIFDFLTLEESFHERELETGLVQHVEKFLLELGQGFAFVGRQYPLTVGEDDFYIDLLFYHLKLRCFMVIELKRGKFKPEYAGKMNFYCSVVDDYLKHATDQPTIGLILCQTKDRILAEYALRDIHKPIGVADYEFSRILPTELASSLPSIEEIESELQSGIGSNEETI
jgi:predicted nuclease of restriction endonuclease-like (RecB) superfamily